MSSQRRWHLALWVTLLMVAVLIPRPGQAAWPNHPAQAVTISVTSGAQDSVQACSDGAGGAILVWQDRRGATFDVYAMRVQSNGVLMPGWTADGTAICTAAGDQVSPSIVSDGNGGAIIAWADSRGDGTTFDIYAQRVSAAGNVQWAANGVALCVQPNDQRSPLLVPDGVGGALVTWSDRRASPATSDIYATRILVNGTVHPSWTGNGTAVCNASGLQLRPAVISDGAGGVIVAWQDRRAGNYDIYAQRISGAAAIAWTSNGVAVCSDDSLQASPAITSDLDNGAVIAWEDGRRVGSDSDIYAQRINNAGLPAWTTGGVVVTNLAQSQYRPSLVPDGFGGAIIGWTDGRSGTDDIYAQLMTSGGGATWPTNGVAVCNAAGAQILSGMVSDGGTLPGALFVWEDARNPSIDIYAGRIRQTGNAPYCWDLGVPVSTAAGAQQSPAIVNDGVGGAIIAFSDSRRLLGGVTPDIAAQRIEGQLGFLGNPAPANVVADDVPNDNGGWVRLRWTASFLDTRDPTYDQKCDCGVIRRYRIWRHVAPFAASLALTRGEATLLSGPAAEATGPRRKFLARPAGAATDYWELVANHEATGLPAYSMIVPTPYDSVLGSNPGIRLFVQAQTVSGPLALAAGGLAPSSPEANEDCEAEWDSDPTGTSSSDNQAPAPPFPFTGSYSGSVFVLRWSPSDASDLDFYRVYRGADVNFVPDAGSLIASVLDTTITDPAGANYYKLSAIDVHGNESGFTLLRYRDIAGAPEPGGVPAPWLARAAPNPFSASTRIRFGVPSSGPALLTIHDVSGRLVRTLLDTRLSAGQYESDWDGRDDAGRPAPGSIYFYRLAADGAVQAGRVVRVP